MVIINQLVNLEKEIKNNFICSYWTCFKQTKLIKRKWLSIIKYLLKDMEYKIISLQLKDDKNNHSDTIYKIYDDFNM